MALMWYSHSSSLKENWARQVPHCSNDWILSWLHENMEARGVCVGERDRLRRNGRGHHNLDAFCFLVSSVYSKDRERTSHSWLSLTFKFFLVMKKTVLCLHMLLKPCLLSFHNCSHNQSRDKVEWWIRTAPKLVSFSLQRIHLFCAGGTCPESRAAAVASSMQSGKGEWLWHSARVSWLVKVPDSTLIACCKTLGHGLGESSYGHNNTLCAQSSFQPNQWHPW